MRRDTCYIYREGQNYWNVVAWFMGEVQIVFEGISKEECVSYAIRNELNPVFFIASGISDDPHAHLTIGWGV